jgi:excisionase family DNA binding protein
MRLVERRPDGTEEYTLTVKYERPKLRLAVREVAELLGCTPRTVYRYLDCGLLRGENLGRKMTRVFAESVQELRSRGAAE